VAPGLAGQAVAQEAADPGPDQQLREQAALCEGDSEHPCDLGRPGRIY
jgi:hypothetical protein